MGLQLRLTHPLDDAILEFEERPADHPIVVGTDPAADVPLPPSLPGVSPRHCFLFVHTGEWYVQDARTPDGTYWNGQPIQGPTAVTSGDVVTLGAVEGAVTLTIDPYGAGQVAADAPAVAAVGWPAGPTLETAVAPKATTTPFYVPGRRTASPAAITVTAMIVLAVLVGGGLWLRGAYQKREEALKPRVIVVGQPADPAPATPNPRPGAAPTTFRASPAPQASGVPVEPPPPPNDPRRSQPEWQAIEAARFEDPVLAIVRFNDYLERFPSTPFRADVEQFVEEALDRIWWQRLIGLFEERDTAAKQVDELKGQLAISQDPAFKKNLESQLADWTERRARADETIRKTMNYQPTSPPNPYDSVGLVALRAQRDSAYFETWKADVLRSIQRSRGQRLPWKGSR